jgi:branched-chain amino acid transport system ATP-binding protein
VALFETRRLAKDFGGVRALDGLDLHVDEGEVVSVIGPNGAGKTTFFNVVTGMMPPDGGELLFDDQNISGLRPNQILELGIARTFQNVRLFPEMTVRENVMVSQHVRTTSPGRRPPGPARHVPVVREPSATGARSGAGLGSQDPAAR